MKRVKPTDFPSKEAVERRVILRMILAGEFSLPDKKCLRRLQTGYSGSDAFVNRSVSGTVIR
jgi:hypothetical protein